MDELSIDAAYEAAAAVARTVVSSEVSPYAGGTKIWKEIVERLEPPIPDDLWSFKSNASAIEDCRWNEEQTGVSHNELIAECEKEIVAIPTPCNHLR